MASGLSKLVLGLLVAAAGAFLYDPTLVPALAPLMPRVLMQMTLERSAVGALVVLAGLLSAGEGALALLRRPQAEPFRPEPAEPAEPVRLAFPPAEPAAESPAAEDLTLVRREIRMLHGQRPDPPAESSGVNGAAFAERLAAGDALVREGRAEDALDPFEEALGLAREAVAARPADAGARDELAQALTRVAEVHDQRGRLDTALPLYEESLALRRALAAEASGDAAAQRNLFLALERLAECRDSRGHSSRALSLFREAEAVAAGDTGGWRLAAELAEVRGRIEALAAPALSPPPLIRDEDEADDWDDPGIRGVETAAAGAARAQL